MSELWMQQSVVYCGASCCMHITCGCGSVLLCRCSDTFAFMGDVIFAHKPTLLDFAPAEAQCTRSLELDYKLRAVIPVAGRRTHGTTSRALTVTFRVATPGAKSAVYDWLVQMCIGVFVVCTDASSSVAVRSGALCDERRRTR